VIGRRRKDYESTNDNYPNNLTAVFIPPTFFRVLSVNAFTAINTYFVQPVEFTILVARDGVFALRGQPVHARKPF
jgi:hypothetical protein